MQFVVRPATAQDALRAAVIEEAAYSTDPVAPALFPGPFPPDALKARAETLASVLETDKDCRWVKVIDTSREAAGEEPMISFAMWCFWEMSRPPHRPSDWGPGTNPEACQSFIGAAHKKYCALMRESKTSESLQPHALLSMVHTDPQLQGKGAGSMLVKWGVDEADRLGLPCYLEASGAGLSLYKKHGFEIIDEIKADLSKWGGPVDAKITAMRRRGRIDGTV